MTGRSCHRSRRVDGRDAVAPRTRRRSGGQDAVLDAAASPEDERMFQALRALRTAIAREEAVPPYVVFHDRTLREMVAARPEDLAGLSQVSGVGAAKLERYGERFLAVLAGEGDPA